MGLCACKLPEQNKNHNYSCTCHIGGPLCKNIPKIDSYFKSMKSIRFCVYSFSDTSIHYFKISHFYKKKKMLNEVESIKIIILHECFQLCVYYTCMSHKIIVF